MVAIVGGAGLGLFNSSLNQLNGYGVAGSGRVGIGNDRVYVNASTGNLVIQSQDDYLAALGLDLAAVRTYNSRGQLAEETDNWQMSFFRRLINLPAAGATTPIIREGGDGHRATFNYVSTNLWRSTDGSGAHDELYKDGNGVWTYRDGSNGLWETYDASGRIVSQQTADTAASINQRIKLTFAYSGSSNRITQITDGTGQVTTLNYDANNNLTFVQTNPAAGASIRVRYGYDGQNRLTSVKVDLASPGDTTADSGAGKTFTTAYGYDGSSRRITSITQRDDASPSITIARLEIGYQDLGGGNYVVSKLRQLEGGTTYRETLFNYDTADRRTDVYDPLGALISYYYDGSDRLLKVVQPQREDGLRSATTYAYDTDGNVRQVVMQIGGGQTRTIDYTYDRGNLTEVRDSGGNAVSRTYSADDLLLTETVYLQSGATPSQPQTTRYVYDGERHLRYVISAEGRVTRHAYYDHTHNATTPSLNRDGELASTTRYTGDTQVYAGAATLSGLDAWVDGLDKSQAERTDFTYDALGQLISSTRYTSLNAATGAGTAGAVTLYAYSPSGELKMKTELNPDGSVTTAVTSYTYDGFGRVLTVTDASNRTSTYRYDDVNNTVVLTSDQTGGASGAYRLRTTSVYNKAGELITQTQTGSASGTATGGALGTTQYSYDANGRLRMTTDPTGGRTHYFYDAAGRLVGQVNAEGELTESVYDGSGLLVRSIRYDGRIPVGSLIDGSNKPLPLALSDLRGKPVALAGQPGLDLNGSGVDGTNTTTLYKNLTGSVAVAPNLVLSDDGTTLDSVLVTIDNIVDLGSETLVIAANVLSAQGLKATWAVNGKLGSLMLESDSSTLRTKAAYQTALRALQYRNAVGSPASYGTKRIIRFSISDGELGSMDRKAEVTISRAPLVQINNATAPVFQEGGQGVPVAPGLTLTDPDSSLVSVTATLIQAWPGDLLKLSSVPAGFSAVYANNTLTLTAIAPGKTLAEFQAALRNLVFQSTSENPNTTDRSIIIIVNDGEQAHQQTAIISVEAVNDAPTVSHDGTPGQYTENMGPTDIVGGTLTLNDVDNPRITEATAQLLGALDPAGEFLSVDGIAAAAAGINVDYNLVTGRLRLWSAVPVDVSEYQTLLSGLRYEGLADIPAASRSLEIKISDGALTSNAIAVVINISPANDAPVLDANGPLYAGIEHWVSMPGWGNQVLIGGQMSLVDPDGDAQDVKIYSATAAIDDFAILSEFLSATAKHGITVQPMSGNTLNFTGEAKLWQYLEVLQTLTYERRLLGSLMLTNRVVKVKVNDGLADSALATINVLKRNSDLPPAATEPEPPAPGPSVLPQQITASPPTLPPLPAESYVIGTPPSPVFNGPGNGATTDTPVLPILLAPISTGMTGIGAPTNRVTEFVHDVAGRLVYTVADDTESVGGAESRRRTVSEFQYDGAGRLVKEIHYLQRLNTSVSLARTAIAATLLQAGSGFADNPENRIIRHFYDADGLKRAILDGEGYLTENRYDGAGRLIEQVRYAAATAAGLRASGSLVDLRPATDAANDQRDRNFYDGRGQLVAAIDALGYFTQYSYNNAGARTREERFAKAVVYTAAKTISQYVAEATPASGLKSWIRSYEYDPLGRIKDQTESTITGGATTVLLKTSYAYSASTGFLGRVTRGSELAAGASEYRSTSYEYDALGRVVKEAEGEGSEAIRNAADGAAIANAYAAYGSRHQYDLSGRRTKTTEASGRVHFYYYDNQGRLRYTISTASVAGQGEVSETVYNGFGEASEIKQYGATISLSGLTEGTALGAVKTRVDAVANAVKDRVTSMQYTLRGQLKQSSDAAGDIRQRIYDAFGQVVQRIDRVRLSSGAASVARTDVLAYDRRGLLKNEIVDSSGLGIGVATAYDAFGRAYQKTDALGRLWRTTYDRLGRVVSMTDPLNQGTATTYDAYGRTLTQTDKLGKLTTYAYSMATAGRRIITVITPEGVTTRTTYDRYGSQVKIELTNNGVIETAEWRYDRDGRLKTQTADATGLALVNSNEHNKAGQLISTINRAGVRTSYVYDPAGRVLTRTLDPVSYRNPDGSLGSNPGGLNLQTQYAYDALGSVIKVTDPEGVVTETLFDQKGQVLAVVVDTVVRSGKPAPLKQATVYSYDADGRVLMLKEGVLATGSSGSLNVTGVAQRTTSYEYDKAGRCIRQVVGGSVVTNYEYDKNGNLVLNSNPGKGAAWRSYYDELNREIFSVDLEQGVIEKIYDKLGRVTREIRYAGTLAFSPNASTTVVALRTAVAAIASAGARSTWNVYDADGRLVYQIDAVGQLTKLQYDEAGRLLKTTVYAKLVSTASLPGIVTETDIVLPATSADDQHSYRIYDSAGRERYQVDSSGSVVESVYDTAGRNVQNIRYIDELTPGTLPDTLTMASMSVPASGGSRQSYTVYDKAGRVAYTIGERGQLIQYLYDKAGNVTKTTEFFAPLPSGTVLSKVDIDSVIGSLPDSARSVITRYVYDGAGREIYELRTLSESLPNYTVLVRERQYGALGLISATIEYYSRSITLSADAPSFTALTSAISTHADTSRDKRTSYFYDGAGRLAYEVDGLLGLTAMTYDNAGRLLSSRKFVAPLDGMPSLNVADIENHVSTSKQDADRLSQNVYDLTGNLIYQIDPLGSLTGYKVDRFGNVTQTTRYASEVSVDTAVSRANLDAHVASSQDRKSWSVYDIRGRKLYDVDALGYVTSYVWDNFDNLLEVRQYSANVATTALGYEPAKAQIELLLPQAAPLWSQDFTSGAAGLTITPATGFIQPSGGKLSMTSPANSTAGGGAVGLFYSLASGYPLTFRADLNTGASSSGRRVSIGLGNNQSGDAYRNIFIYLHDNQAYALIGKGGQSQQILLGTTSNNKDMVVEVELGAAGAGATVYLYEKGQARESGFVHSAELDWIGQARVLMTANGSGGTTTSTLTLDNASLGTDIGRRSRAYYDIEGRKIYEIDALGYATRNFYDKLGQLIESTRYGVPLDVSRLSPGSTLAELGAMVQAAFGRRTLYVYDAVGQLRYSLRVSATQVGGVRAFVTEQKYDGLGLLTDTIIYDKELLIEDLSLEGVSNVMENEGAVALDYNKREHREYDRLGRLISLTDAAGGIERYTYDGLGNLFSLVNKLAQPGNESAYTWHYDYDANGRRIEERAPLENYVGSNGIVQGHKTTLNQYNAFGELYILREGARPSAAGVFTESRRTIYHYDQRGLQLEILPQGGNYSDGESLSQTSSENFNTRTWADAYGQAIVNSNLEGSFSFKVYDAKGRVAYDVDEGRYVTAYTYDAFGNVLTLTRHSDALDLQDQRYSMEQIQSAVLGSTEQRDLVNALHVIVSARARELISAQPRTLTMRYDDLDRKISVKQPEVDYYVAATGARGRGRPATEFAYDGFGQQIRERILRGGESDWLTTYYTYDSLGRQTRKIDAMGYLTQSKYDVFDRLVEIREYANAIGPIATIQDAESAMPSESLPVLNGSGQVTYVPSQGVDRIQRMHYDEMDREIGRVRVGAIVDSVLGRTVSSLVESWRSYDALGNVTASADSLGNVTRTWYDKLGRVIKVADPQRDSVSSGSRVSLSTWQMSWSTLRQQGTVFDLSVNYTPLLNWGSGDVRVTFTYDVKLIFGSWQSRTSTRTLSAVEGMAGATLHLSDIYGALIKGAKVEKSIGGTWITIAESVENPDNPFLDVGGLPGNVTSLSMTYVMDGISRVINFYKVGDHFLSPMDALSPLSGDAEFTLTARNSQGQPVNLTAVGGDAGGTISGEIDLVNLAGVGTISSSIKVSGSDTSLVPVTTFAYDILGYERMSLRHAKGGTVSGEDIVPITDIEDQATWKTYTRGLVDSIWDAAGSREYFQYDRMGRMVTRYRDQKIYVDIKVDDIVDLPSATVSNAERYRYDALGRSIEMSRTKIGSAGLPDGEDYDHATYNAFGEIVYDDPGVFTDYDAAGRAWQSNAGNGVTKISEYDLTGALSSVSELPGIVDSWYGDRFVSRRLQQVSDMWAVGGINRTRYERDLLGRVTKTWAPEFEEHTEGTPIRSALVPREQEFQSGGLENGQYFHMFSVLPLSSIPVASLAVEIDYRVAGSSTVYTKRLSGSSNVALDGGFIRAFWYGQTGAPDNAQINFVKARVYSGSTITLQTDSSPQIQFWFSPPVGMTLESLMRYRSVSSTTLKPSGDWRSSMVQGQGGSLYRAAVPAGNGVFEYEFVVNTQVTLLSGAIGQQPKTARGYFQIKDGVLTTLGSVVSNTALYRPVSTQTVDRWGNVLSVTDARDSSLVTRYRYNYRNQITEEILPAAKTYDARGVLSANAITATSYVYYDTEGRRLAVTDANGHTSIWRYDAAGQMVEEIDAMGGVTQHIYDALGREVAVRNANGTETVKVYDQLDRLIRQETLGLRVAQHMTYEYDQFGNRIGATNALGEFTRYQYDTQGRLLKEYSPLSFILRDNDLSTTYKYDEMGRVIQDRKGDGANVYSLYDDFGRLLETGVFGGVVRQSRYDAYGRLIRKMGTTAEGAIDIRYDYYANGLLKSVHDLSTNFLESFSYDLSGNRIRETRLFTNVEPGEPTYQEAMITEYDSRNQIVKVINNWFEQVTGYDAVGNKIYIQTTHKPDSNPIFERDSTAPVVEAFWYAYDDANRMLVTQGDRFYVTYADPALQHLNGWTISATQEKGSELGYDGVGNRVYERSYSKDENVWRHTSNVYDQANQLVGTYSYRGDFPLTVAGSNGGLRSARGYDGAGRVIEYVEADRNGGRITLRKYSVYNPNGWILQERVLGSSVDPYVVYYTYRHALVTNPNVALAYRNQIGEYDKDGSLRSYGVEGPDVRRKTYDYYYTNDDIKRVRQISLYDHNDNHVGTSRMEYDPNGNMVYMYDQYNSKPERHYVVNSSGQILRRIDKKVDTYSKAVGQHYLISGGRLLASAGTVAEDVFDYNYQPVSENYPASTPSQYVARDGERFQDIALAVYGDASLWYLIADANGLVSEADIVEGMSLRIPNRITNIHNSDDTFQPYNPGDSIGNMTPTAKPPKRRCGVLAKIIQVVVTVVVTVVTGNPVAGAAAGNYAGQITYLAANGELDWGKFLGWSVVSPWLAAEKASDGRFSSTSMATDAAVAAVTWGIAEGLNWAGTTYNINWLKPVTQAAANGTTTTTMSAGRAFVQGALGSVAGQGVANAIAGRHVHFSWGQVLGSALAGSLSQGQTTQPVREYMAGVNNPFLHFGGNLLAQAAYSFVGQRVAERHGKIDMEDIFIDAFGNAIGNSIVGAMQRGGERSKLSPQEREYYDRAIDSGLSHDDAMKIGRGGPGFMGGLANTPELRDALLSTSLAPAGTAVADDGSIIVTRTGPDEDPPPVREGYRTDGVSVDPETGEYLWREIRTEAAMSVSGETVGFDISALGQTDGYQRFAGGILGVGSSLAYAADGMVRMLGNSVLQIGDILTGGYNHDDPLMQQAWIEQGALAAGIGRLVSDPVGVMFGARDYLTEQYATAEHLERAGEVFGAAALRAKTSADAAGILLGGADALSMATGGALSQMGRVRFDIVDVGNVGAMGQRGAIGIRVTIADSALGTAARADVVLDVGGTSGFSKVTTPWQRAVYQRSDIEMDLVRPDGLTNQQAVRQGYSPMRVNPETGKWDDVVLHHLNDDPRGGLAEVWRSTHGRYHQTVAREPNPWRTQRPDWARAWNNEQSAYWRWRSGAYKPQPTDSFRLPGD
jgi:YD repeat-containing protein